MNNSPELPQVTVQETAEIIHLAQQVLLDSIEGDFVELGCYKGDTSLQLAKLLAAQRAATQPPSYITKRILYLYDSFAGLPPRSPEDASSIGENFKAGELFVTKREVIDKLRHAGLDLRYIKVKKAFFEELNPTTDLPSQIALAFLDGDLYNSIQTSLQLVAPRLQARGLIIVHDYNNPELPGVALAVDEFLARHHEYFLQQRFSLAILRVH